MIWEFQGYYDYAKKDKDAQLEIITKLDVLDKSALERWSEFADLDAWSRLLVLSQAIATPSKNQARMGTQEGPGGYQLWLEKIANEFFKQQHGHLERLSLCPALPDMKILPPGSWGIQLTFTLKKPYISKDDTEFYIIDNPVRKEWVFKVPYVAPSQWKGALRAAMRRLRGYTTWEQEGQDPQMVRLFGNVKGEQEEFRAGRLHFYPTFFDQIGLEVINPHDRETGAGTQPIYLECVPAGAKGTFTLLYVPLDNGPVDEATVRDDLRAVADGLQEMFTRQGFGAKTSSGYGIVEDKVDGYIRTQSDVNEVRVSGLNHLKIDIQRVKF